MGSAHQLIRVVAVLRYHLVQRVPARGRLEGARCNRSGYANYPLHPHLNQVGSVVEPTELIEGDLDSPQRKRFIRSTAFENATGRDPA